MSRWLRSFQSAALWTVALPSGIYLMAFGLVVILGPPTRIGPGFWKPEKLFYGFLPVIGVPCLVTVTFRSWVRLFARARTAWFAFFAAVVISMALDALLFLTLRGSADDNIQLDWQRERAVFSWSVGQVKLPADFTHERGTGIDSFVGKFTSKKRSLIIQYDIGELAGEHEGMGSGETLTKGSRVRLGKSTYSDSVGIKRYVLKVSFPDAGCANFSLESTDEKDGASSSQLLVVSCPEVALRPLYARFYQRSFDPTVGIA